MFTGNILYSSGKPIIACFGHMHEDDPAVTIDPIERLEDGTIVSNFNLLWNTAGEVCYSVQSKLGTLEAAQAAGMDLESVIADPGFADAEHGDFTLPEDSPAYGIGFVPYDWSICGPRK